MFSYSRFFSSPLVSIVSSPSNGLMRFFPLLARHGCLTPSSRYGYFDVIFLFFLLSICIMDFFSGGGSNQREREKDCVFIRLLIFLTVRTIRCDGWTDVFPSRFPAGSVVILSAKAYYSVHAGISLCVFRRIHFRLD